MVRRTSALLCAPLPVKLGILALQLLILLRHVFLPLLPTRALLPALTSNFASLALIILLSPCAFAPALRHHPALLDIIVFHLLLALQSLQTSADLLLLFQLAVLLALLPRPVLLQVTAVPFVLSCAVMLPLAAMGKSVVTPLHQEVQQSVSANHQIRTHALRCAPRAQPVSDRELQLRAPDSAASTLTVKQETGVVLLIKSTQQLAFQPLSLSASLLAHLLAQRNEFVLLTLPLLQPAHAI
jgi:hypothetical protein